MRSGKGVGKKLLVVLDLNGTICHLNKSQKVFNKQGVYSQGENVATPIAQTSKYSLFARPNLNKMTDLLVKEKKKYDIGIWSSAGLEDS